MEKNHPGLVDYGHHHRALFYSTNKAELDAVRTSIKATVGKDKPDSPELPILIEAYKTRFKELETEARLKKVKEAEEEKKLISREPK